MSTQNTMQFPTLAQEHSRDASYYGDIPDWLIVYSRSRDSGLLTQSNWNAFLEALGGEGDQVAITRSGHWLVGWVEYLVVAPDAAEKLALAADLHARLEDYPVLDDEDYSRREWEAYQEAWKDYGCGEFQKALEREFNLAEATCNWLYEYQEELQAFYESLIVSGDYYHAEGDGVNLNIRYAAERCSRDNMARFLRSLRK